MNNKNEYYLVEKNELISNYLLNKFKLWVWDFDDTLIDTATYYNKSMEPKDILMRTDDQLTEDIPNWIYFKKLVNYLISRGVRVAIASFGTFKIIKAYMDRIFGLNQHIFDTANLKALCRDANGKPIRFYPNKNDFIDSIMEHYRIYEPIKVVLFDDVMSNISEAMHSGIVGVKIKGKDSDITLSSSPRSMYSNDTKNVFFGEMVLNKLETTLKRLEQEDLTKNNCNNIKNETFSSIGSRKIGTLNKKHRLERETFFNNIKKKYDEEQQEETIEEEQEPFDTTQKNTNYKKNNRKNNRKSNIKPSVLNRVNEVKKKDITDKTDTNEKFNTFTNQLPTALNNEFMIIVIIIIVCCGSLFILMNKPRKKK
jgi:hypothetical protein